jgi:transcriptional regulator with XRE-family HTH domain
MVTQVKMAGSMPAKKEIDTSNYSGRIASRVRELRTKKGWTVADLLERLNRELPKAMQLSSHALHKWDACERKIDPDYYPAIARVFDMSVRGFLPSE